MRISHVPNIVIPENSTGNFSIHLHDVTWFIYRWCGCVPVLICFLLFKYLQNRQLRDRLSGIRIMATESCLISCSLPKQQINIYRDFFSASFCELLQIAAFENPAEYVSTGLYKAAIHIKQGPFTARNQSLSLEEYDSIALGTRALALT